MNYKIVFFDMDGTLYQTQNNVIQQSSLDAIANLRKQGVIICAATGRPLNQMNLILEHVQFDYYVLINGGFVVDKNFNLLFENPITKQDTQDIVDWCEKGKNALMFHFGETSRIYDQFYPLYYFCQKCHVLDRLLYDATRSYHLEQHAYDAVLHVTDEHELKTFVDTHKDLRSDAIGNGYFDVFHAGNDKVVGISHILKMLDISWDECVVFGDSTNDIKMLEMAGVGVVMGSATDYVKSFADIVTESNLNDGVAKGIERIFDIKIS